MSIILLLHGQTTFLFLFVTTTSNKVKKRSGHVRLAFAIPI